MGASKPEKKEKKDKKDKKRAEADGVTKSKSKKDKKEKKEKLKQAVETALVNGEDTSSKKQQKATNGDAESDVEGRDKGIAVDPIAPDADSNPGGHKQQKSLIKAKDTKPIIVGALVPFAKPLADEKATKKVLKSVRKAARFHTLKRGVKEVVKALRKSPAAGPNNQAFPGVVILAGDISPMDVISHIPILCEDVNVPYIFVPSRAELGAAGQTKRPTSVVMVMAEQRPMPDRKSKKDKKAKDDEKAKPAEEEEVIDPNEFSEVYKDLVKLVQKEAKAQLKFT